MDSLAEKLAKIPSPPAPTREQVLVEKVGKRMDCWAHAYIFRNARHVENRTSVGIQHIVLAPDGSHGEPDDFSTDIACAFKIIERMHRWLFSRRMIFIRELDEICKLPDGSRVAGHWILFTVKPEYITKAAIIAALAD